MRGMSDGDRRHGRSMWGTVNAVMAAELALWPRLLHGCKLMAGNAQRTVACRGALSENQRSYQVAHGVHRCKLLSTISCRAGDEPYAGHATANAVSLHLLHELCALSRHGACVGT